MAEGEYRKPERNWFAIAVAAVVFAVGLGMVALQIRIFGIEGGARWAWLAVPVIGAAVVYGSIRRFKGESTVPTTTRTYPLHAPVFRDATLGELTSALSERGYRVTATAQGDGVAMSSGAGLRNAELRLRDQRQRPEEGEVRLNLRVQDSGALLGVIESVDSGAGFYDELAQFAIVRLGELWPELHFAAPGIERKPAASLAAELPEQPYGLSLI